MPQARMTSMEHVRLPIEAALPVTLDGVAAAPAVAIREERASDLAAREALLNAAFGAARFGKTSERLREGSRPARGLALAAHVEGRLAGTLRLWNIEAESGHRLLLLGPLAVDADLRALGIGGELMRAALRRARMRGHGGIVLVGDEPYYRRFGFNPALTQALDMPGPVDRARFLGLELQPGALDGAAGMLRAAGAPLAQAKVWRAAA